MHPILTQFGPVTLYSYGLMLVVAVLAATWLTTHSARQMPPAKRAIAPEHITELVCWLMGGGLVCGRLI